MQGSSTAEVTLCGTCKIIWSALATLNTGFLLELLLLLEFSCFWRIPLIWSERFEARWFVTVKKNMRAICSSKKLNTIKVLTFCGQWGSSICFHRTADSGFITALSWWYCISAWCLTLRPFFTLVRTIQCDSAWRRNSSSMYQSYHSFSWSCSCYFHQAWLVHLLRLSSRFQGGVAGRVSHACYTLSLISLQRG